LYLRVEAELASHTWYLFDVQSNPGAASMFTTTCGGISRVAVN